MHLGDKSHPNSTTNIHDSSGVAGGAAQIPQVNAINDNDKSFTIQPQTSMFLPEEAIITYNASKMILAVHSDAGYANEKKARSHAGGHFFLSSNEPDPPNNGAILTNVTIIKNITASAAEAEIGAIYLNAREAAYLRQILVEMLYGNGDSPFPYGDVSIPVSIWRSPCGNGEPFHCAPYMEMGIPI